jgi:two-component system, cell cycle sensor histidine kinase and response regulator CckA
LHRSGLGVECAPSALVEGAHPESATETVADISPVHPDFAGLAPEGKGPPTILLVEDEALVRDVVDEILSSAGYRVLKARSVGEALRIFHGYQGKVELLLTDVVLPDRNGYDLASEVALLCQGVRTIFISGYPENAVTRRGFRRGRCFYLAKPFSGHTLIQKVTEALQSGST